MGNHMMMPPTGVAEQMVHPEAPPTHPKGPNTNFQYPTPMPFRFMEQSLDKHNLRHTVAKEVRVVRSRFLGTDEGRYEKLAVCQRIGVLNEEAGEWTEPRSPTILACTN